jgi:single-stranded-DNA-specific exonuclease
MLTLSHLPKKKVKKRKKFLKKKKKKCKEKNFLLWYTERMFIPSTQKALFDALCTFFSLSSFSEEERRAFFTPSFEKDTHNPFLLLDLQKAVERIVSAFFKEEKILIWSDYDMDGIPGAVILFETFIALGYENILHYTPSRNKEGFGMNKKGIDFAKEAGVSLIITIDCGSNDKEEVRYAQEKGIDVIITDHHLVEDEKPSAYALVNPKQKECSYPCPMLCGSGVIFKVVQGLLAYMREDSTRVPSHITVPKEGWEKWLLDMVGIATISDMVPLRGENRVFAHFGLIVLRKSKRKGLHALLKKAKKDQSFLTEEDVGFTLAPRINAASRMGHAKTAFELLTSRDDISALSLASILEDINGKRKIAVGVMKREAHTRLKEKNTSFPLIVMGNPEWQPSLLGLLASSLAEEYKCPVFLWGRGEGTVIKGSCRSFGGISVHSLMERSKENFFLFGGHKEAGGFELSEKHVHTLESSLLKSYKEEEREKGKESLKEEESIPLSLSSLSFDTIKVLDYFAPFGMGHPRPLFSFENVKVFSFRFFGKTQEHLEVVFQEREGYKKIKGIAFFTPLEKYPILAQNGASITLLAHMEVNRFCNAHEVRLRIVDVI